MSPKVRIQLNRDIYLETIEFLDIWDAIPLLRASRVAYFSFNLWFTVLCRRRSIGPLACHPRLDFASLPFESLRRIGIRTAALQNNLMVNPCPRWKRVHSYKLGARNDQILFAIPGTPVLIIKTEEKVFKALDIFSGAELASIGPIEGHIMLYPPPKLVMDTSPENFYIAFPVFGLSGTAMSVYQLVVIRGQLSQYPSREVLFSNLWRAPLNGEPFSLISAHLEANTHLSFLPDLGMNVFDALNYSSLSLSFDKQPDTLHTKRIAMPRRPDGMHGIGAVQGVISSPTGLYPIFWDQTGSLHYLHLSRKGMLNPSGPGFLPLVPFISGGIKAACIGPENPVHPLVLMVYSHEFRARNPEAGQRADQNLHSVALCPLTILDGIIIADEDNVHRHTYLRLSREAFHLIHGTSGMNALAVRLEPHPRAAGTPRVKGIDLISFRVGTPHSVRRLLVPDAIIKDFGELFDDYATQIFDDHLGLLILKAANSVEVHVISF